MITKQIEYFCHLLIIAAVVSNQNDEILSVTIYVTTNLTLYDVLCVKNHLKPRKSTLSDVYLRNMSSETRSCEQ